MISKGRDVPLAVHKGNVPNDQMLVTLVEYDVHLNDSVLEVVDLLPVGPNWGFQVEPENVHLELGVCGELTHFQMGVGLDRGSIDFVYN